MGSVIVWDANFSREIFFTQQGTLRCGTHPAVLGLGVETARILFGEG